VGEVEGFAGDDVGGGGCGLDGEAETGDEGAVELCAFGGDERIGGEGGEGGAEGKESGDVGGEIFLVEGGLGGGGEGVDFLAGAGVAGGPSGGDALE
jgi:hypothetical protein